MTARKPIGPHFSQRDYLQSLPPEYLGDHVDVAFTEFMHAISRCIAGVPFPAEKAIGWVLANMAAAGGYGWTTDLAARGLPKNLENSTEAARTFSEMIVAHVATLPANGEYP
jgi:hypothetical protein